VGSIPAQSTQQFWTTRVADSEVWELYIQTDSGEEIFVTRVEASNTVCPLRYEGCCGGLTLVNDGAYTVNILVEVYFGDDLESRSVETILPCSEQNTTACQSQVIEFNNYPRTVLVLQKLPDGEYDIQTISTDQNLSDNCPVCIITTGTTGTSATTGTTGTSVTTQITTTEISSTTGHHSCPPGSPVTSPDQCKGGSTFNSDGCFCENCRLLNLEQPCQQGEELNGDTCECVGGNSTTGGSASTGSTTVIAGSLAGAASVAGAVGAAAWFLMNRKKRPQEEVLETTDVFANVVEQNPLYLDPVPTYENPIYEYNE